MIFEQLYQISLYSNTTADHQDHQDHQTERHSEDSILLHTFKHRYSEFVTFRSNLKRILFVENCLVRLPALPPKVWGSSRSSSDMVVEQRQIGIQEFLNVLLALSELSAVVQKEFFHWMNYNTHTHQRVEEADDADNADGEDNADDENEAVVTDRTEGVKDVKEGKEGKDGGVV